MGGWIHYLPSFCIFKLLQKSRCFHTPVSRPSLSCWEGEIDVFLMLCYQGKHLAHVQWVLQTCQVNEQARIYVHLNLNMWTLKAKEGFRPRSPVGEGYRSRWFLRSWDCGGQPLKESEFQQAPPEPLAGSKTDVRPPGSPASDKRPSETKTSSANSESQRRQGAAPCTLPDPSMLWDIKSHPCRQAGFLQAQDIPSELCSDSLGSQASVKALASPPSAWGTASSNANVRCHPVTLCTKRTNARKGGGVPREWATGRVCSMFRQSSQLGPQARGPCLPRIRAAWEQEQRWSRLLGRGS